MLDDAGEFLPEAALDTFDMEDVGELLDNVCMFWWQNPRTN